MGRLDLFVAVRARAPQEQLRLLHAKTSQCIREIGEYFLLVWLPRERDPACLGSELDHLGLLFPIPRCQQGS